MENFKLPSIHLSSIESEKIEPKKHNDSHDVKPYNKPKKYIEKNTINNHYSDYDSEENEEYTPPKNNHARHNLYQDMPRESAKRINYVSQKTRKNKNQYKNDRSDSDDDLEYSSERTRSNKQKTIHSPPIDSSRINNYAQMKIQLISLTGNIDQLEKIENDILTCENNNQTETLKNQRADYFRLYLKSLKSLVKKTISTKKNM